jgi:CubicO group peptidase (beta-lactamase class C family)
MYIVGIVILAIIIALNLFIILTGRFYLYKGIANTYMVGKTGPGIYDLRTFPFRTIPSSKKKIAWEENDNINTYKLSKKEKRFMRHNGTTAFLVFKDGKMLYEKYWEDHDEVTVSNSFSAAKTVVSILVGIALKEGKIKNIDEAVSNYIPSYASEDRKEITIRHLLYMASGLEWGESGANPVSHNAESYYGKDLRGLCDRLEGIDPPNELFLYQSGNSQLLGFILEKATGKRLSDYAAKMLWKPLGAESLCFGQGFR